MINLRHSGKAAVYTAAQFLVAVYFPTAIWVWAAISILSAVCIVCAVKWPYRHEALHITYDFGEKIDAVAVLLGAALGLLASATLAVSLGVLK